MRELAVRAVDLAPLLGQREDRGDLLGPQGVHRPAARPAIFQRVGGLARLPVARAPLAQAEHAARPAQAPARAGRLSDQAEQRVLDIADLSAAASALLGEERGARFMAEVRAKTIVAQGYRYPRFERIVPAGGVLGRGESHAIAAYVLFERAQAGGGCAPHLNQLLLLTAEVLPDWEMIRTAGARAAAACPGDPTAGWLLGLFESQLDPRAGLQRMRVLRREFPGAAAVWSQEADAIVRVAYVTPATRPFVARHLYERALAGYGRARRLGAPRAELDLGIARARRARPRP